MSVGSHHLVHYIVSIANGFPIVLTVVLGTIAVAIFIVAAAEESLGLFFIAITIGSFIAIPGTLMKWHHKEPRSYYEMLIDTGKDHVWIPAYKLPNGDWWPNHARLKQ